MPNNNDFWKKNSISVGLVYPNQLKVMLSSYTIRFLHNYLREFGIFSDTFSLPDKRVFPASKDFNPLDRLKSFEYQHFPNEFDILGFSLHYENDLKNLLWFLEKANIPLTTHQRMESNNRYPIIVSGGPVITSNPLPFSNFIDLCFIGDSEKSLIRFIEKFIRFKNQRYLYEEFINKAKKIPGVYIPFLDNKVSRQVLRDLDESPIPTYQNPYKLPEGQFENYFFIEVNRGCPYRCKFCLSSYHNHPFRNRSYQNIVRSIDEGIKRSQFQKISLIGSCASSHPHFKDICEYILKNGKQLSVPSIRIDHITPELISLFEKAKIKTLTIAPEAGSEVLRFRIGKQITNKTIFNTIKKLRESKIRNLKLYFLIGLPEETDRDIDQIIDFIHSLNEMQFNKDSLRININPFIPKLNTPFEFQSLLYIRENLSTLLSRLNYLVKNLSNIPSVKLKVRKTKTLINEARMQALISLGDKEISNLLLDYYRNGANFGALRRAEKKLDISIDNYFKKINSGYKPWKQ